MSSDPVSNRMITNDNISLIGMPGAGKSTLGVLLAKRTSKNFVDTDLLVQERASAPLHEIIEQHGTDAFRKLERECVLQLEPTGHVIATGGSVVYSDAAMEHLQQLGIIVYLDVPASELENRIGDLGARGVVREPGEGIAEIQQQRAPLYQRWADVRVACESSDHEDALSAIEAALSQFHAACSPAKSRTPAAKA